MRVNGYSRSLRGNARPNLPITHVLKHCLRSFAKAFNGDADDPAREFELMWVLIPVLRLARIATNLSLSARSLASPSNAWVSDPRQCFRPCVMGRFGRALPRNDLL